MVSSVSKVLKVNKDFLNICPDVKYPEEFPYKSKVRDGKFLFRICIGTLVLGSFCFCFFGWEKNEGTYYFVKFSNVSSAVYDNL